MKNRLQSPYSNYITVLPLLYFHFVAETSKLKKFNAFIVIIILVSGRTNVRTQTAKFLILV